MEVFVFFIFKWFLVKSLWFFLYVDCCKSKICLPADQVLTILSCHVYNWQIQLKWSLSHKKLYLISFRTYKNDFTTFFLFCADNLEISTVDPHHRWPHGHANFYFCNRKSSLTQKSLRNYFSLSRKSILRKQQKVAVNNLMTLLGWKWNI